MMNQHRWLKICLFRFALILFSSSLGSLACWGDSNIPREKLPAGWKAAADLTDVFFLNQNLGWAVGGQGVVLRTVNGGKDWIEISQLNQSVANEIPLDQKYRNMRRGVSSQWTGVANGRSANQGPFRCRFESVHFINERIGWVAGGYDVPMVDRSHGVILKTMDGGLSWKPIEGLVVPRIKRIHFSNESSGWAIGEVGNLFRTGIYQSSNGGQTWSSASADKLRDWIDGDRVQQGFVCVDRSGIFGAIKQDRYEASVLLGEPASPVNCVRMQDDQRGWAVGNRGTILRTDNAGLSWTSAVNQTDDPALQHFDFHGLSITANKIWLVGNPGSMVFSLDLQSGQLESHATGVALPLADVHFVDDQNGWVVGSLGTILVTSDGGKSWQVQRGTHRGLAMLAIVFDQQDLPLELLATFAGEENRICGVAVNRGEFSSAGIQAAERVGSSSCLGRIGRDIDSEESQLEELVRMIRVMRPIVVVCNSKPQARTHRHDPETLIVRAIRAAADQAAFPNQLDQAGLKPWQVDRLAVLDFTGGLTIDPLRMLPRTGSLVEDQIALSRSLIGLPMTGTDPKTYRVQHFTVANHSRESDLFRGLGQLGRPIPTFDAGEGFRGNLQAIQLANSKHEKLDLFASYQLDSSQDFRSWHQQVLSWMLTLDEDVAGIWLVELAERYLVAGKTELAAKTLEMLATRIPDHAFSTAALTWLAQHYASDEMGEIAFQALLASAKRTDSGGRQNPYETRPTEIVVNGTRQLIWTPVDAENGSWNESSRAEQAQLNDVQSLGASLASHEQSELTAAEKIAQQRKQSEEFLNGRWRLASQFLNRLGQRDPEIVAGAQYRMIEASINRKLNGVLSIESLLKQLVQRGGENAPGISAAARRELVVGGVLPQDANPLEAMVCQRTHERPRLDGQLDDPVWQSAAQNGLIKAMSRGAGDAAMNQKLDAVAFAFDDEFLYLAIRCFKIQGQYYEDTAEPRPRDPDLSRRDRVEISLDLDRDYRSYDHFVIDNRGWVADRCGAATGWDPEWYVSHSSDDESWTAEIAIPLSQLATREINDETTWAVRLARCTYDDENLWEPAAVDSPDRSEGMRIGFLSQPAQYELMRFK